MLKFLTLTALLLASTAAGAAEYTVKMKFDEEAGKVYYEPATLNIKSGDTVTWVQTDSANEHNIVAVPNGIPKGTDLFESPQLQRMNERWSYTFNTSGTYRYHCHPHEAIGMTGVVIVDRESRADEIRSSKAYEHMHGIRGMPLMGGRGHNHDGHHDYTLPRSQIAQ